jgi:hypothetical protein
MSAEDLKKLSHDDLAKHAQEGWDLAASLRGDVVYLENKVHRLSGPFTCHHAPEYLGSACATCHGYLIDAIEEIGRHCSGGIIKDLVDRALASVTRRK